jgi:hypothetical protein
LNLPYNEQDLEGQQRNAGIFQWTGIIGGLYSNDGIEQQKFCYFVSIVMTGGI